MRGKFYVLLLLISIPLFAKAQLQAFKDSLIELSGVTMTADSLRAVPDVTVLIRNEGRGTFSNEKGIFSIVALRGDTIEFRAVGYRSKLIKVPANIKGNHFSMIQLMAQDTMYLPETIIRPYPTKEEFNRAFATWDIPDDQYEIARKNTNAAKLRALALTTPMDAGESVNQHFTKEAQKLYYNGQTPPLNIFNPVAWGQFIQAWKRGDFKRQ